MSKGKRAENLSLRARKPGNTSERPTRSPAISFRVKNVLLPEGFRQKGQAQDHCSQDEGITGACYAI